MIVAYNYRRHKSLYLIPSTCHFVMEFTWKLIGVKSSYIKIKWRCGLEQFVGIEVVWHPLLHEIVDTVEAYAVLRVRFFVPATCRIDAVLVVNRVPVVTKEFKRLRLDVVVVPLTGRKRLRWRRLRLRSWSGLKMSQTRCVRAGAVRNNNLLPAYRDSAYVGFDRGGGQIGRDVLLRRHGPFPAIFFAVWILPCCCCVPVIMSRRWTFVRSRFLRRCCSIFRDFDWFSPISSNR